MLMGFDTEDHPAAVAALMIYAVWRSRSRRLRITPDIWGQVERFTKASAKRAQSLPAFLEALKPRLCCETISPKWMAAGAMGEIPLTPVHDSETGALRYVMHISGDGPRREFLTQIIGAADAGQVLDRLYRETAWCVLLVRDRLERERPIEQFADLIDAEECR